MIALLLAVTVTIRPAAPAVGDPITLEYPVPAGARVVVTPSPQFEVVRASGGRVVVRTFEPRPFTVEASTGGRPLGSLTVPVRSVLPAGDNMQPAPLAPPQAPPAPRRPLVMIGAAALAAAAAWLALLALVRRRQSVKEVEMVPAAEQFRRAIDILRGERSRPLRWASLADATRAYLASARPELGKERTTSQLLAMLDPGETTSLVAEILEQGDLEKFSPWGAPMRNFDDLSARARSLPDYLEPPPVEEAAA